MELYLEDLTSENIQHILIYLSIHQNCMNLDTGFCVNIDTNDKPTAMQLEEAEKGKTMLLLMLEQVQTQSSELMGECHYPKSSSWYLRSPLKYSLLFVLFQNTVMCYYPENQLDLLNITSNMIVYSHGDRPHEPWLHLDNPLKILGFYLLWSYC